MSARLVESSRRGRLVERSWASRPDAPGGRSSRQAFTYYAYEPAPIAEEEFSLNSTIAAESAKAEAAVIQLNADPPAPLNLEALTRQLLRAEAVASSRIEGLVLGHRRLARAAFAPDESDITAASVLANIAALEHAVATAGEARVITTERLLEVHRMLFAGTRDEHVGGLLRTEQNWIGGHASSPRSAEFVPPPAERVSDLLDDLCAFVDRDDVPTVIQAAIAHAQFESIHPFPDGNGRVGRALILAILRRRGIAPRYLPPVSLALAGDADRYIAALTSFRNGHEEDWYAVFIDAVLRAATRARAFAEDVARLQERWLVLAGSPRAGAGARRLIELLPANPVIDVAAAKTLLGGSRERSRQAIVRLEAAGVLQSLTTRRRNRAWEAVGLFDLLDRFERELGDPHRTPRPTR